MMDCCDDGYVWTELYITVPNRSLYKAIELPDRNYDNYMIFSLNSYLSHWVSLNWHPDIEITFISRNKPGIDDKLYLTVQPLIGGDILEMNKEMRQNLQNYLNTLSITKLKSVLLYGFGLNRRIVTKQGYVIEDDWIRQLISYVGIDDSLNPHIDEIGMHVELGWIPQYTEVYRLLSINLTEKLIEMYEQGCVIEPSQSFLNDWLLIPQDDRKIIYAPTWRDTRITNNYGSMVKFLETRIMGIKTINFKIDKNETIRHYLIHLLREREIKNDFIMTKYYLRIEINDLYEAQLIATLIDYAVEKATGIVILKHVKYEREVEIYELISEKMLKISHSLVSYRTDDIQRPYTVSFLFDYKAHINVKDVSVQLWNIFNQYRIADALDDRVIKKETKVYEINLKPSDNTYIRDSYDYAEKYLKLDADKPPVDAILPINREIYKPTQEEIENRGVRAWTSDMLEQTPVLIDDQRKILRRDQRRDLYTVTENQLSQVTRKPLVIEPPSEESKISIEPTEEPIEGVIEEPIEEPILIMPAINEKVSVPSLRKLRQSMALP